MARLSFNEKITGNLGTFFCITTFIFFLAYVFGIFGRMGLFLTSLQNVAIGLCLILVLVFIYRPLRKTEVLRNTLPWYDLILILSTFIFNGYIVYNYKNFWPHLGQVTSNIELVLGLVAILIILEACRRTVGLSMVFVIVFFLLYAWAGNYIPGFFNTTGSSLNELSGQMWLSTFGMYGLAMQVVLDYVFGFIMFAAALTATGGAHFFYRLAFAVFKGRRGSSGKVAILLNLFLGMFSGSSIANVYMSGPVILPQMKKEGFGSAYAGGLIATAANAAQLTPPVMGIVAFAMAELLGMRYIMIAATAALPAFLYMVSLYLLVDLDAAKARFSPIIEEQDQEKFSLTKTLFEGWHILVALILLVVLLAGMYTTVRMSVIYSSVVLLLLGMLNKKTEASLKKLKELVESISKNLIEIGPICAGAGLILGVIGLTSLDYKFAVELTILAGDNLVLLLIVAAVACIILGTGLPTLPAYLIVALIITPALIPLGLEPIIIHMFVYYFALAAMVTPPVCLNVYAVAPMVKCSFWHVGLHALRLGIATYVVPFIFVFRPGLLLVGGLSEVVTAVVFSFIATVALCFALARYGFVEASWSEAFLALSGAVLIIIPWGFWYSFLGFGLLALVTIWQLIKWRSQGGVTEVQARLNL